MTRRAVSFGFLFAAAVFAADDLPKAETILDKYVDATGGKAAYAKVKSDISTGTMSMAAMGLSGKLTMYGAAPAKRLMEVTIEAVRPIPSIALLPIALIALGFGYRMEIVIVAFACVWPILILSRAAVRSIEPRLMEVARALRLPPAQRVWKIIIPAALPRIFVAFRLSAGIALIVAVTVEIAINPLGLGAGIMLAQQALRPDLMLAYLVWIGIIGYALNILLTVAQQRLFGRAALSGDGQ